MTSDENPPKTPAKPPRVPARYRTSSIPPKDYFPTERPKTMAEKAAEGSLPRRKRFVPPEGFEIPKIPGDYQPPAIPVERPRMPRAAFRKGGQSKYEQLKTRREMVKKRLEEGATEYEIMDEMALSLQTVREDARSQGIHAMRGRPFKPTTYHILRDLIFTDWSIGKIAKKHNLTKQCISRIANNALEAGIPLKQYPKASLDMVKGDEIEPDRENQDTFEKARDSLLSPEDPS